jgi:hypothetical protein
MRDGKILGLIVVGKVYGFRVSARELFDGEIEQRRRVESGGGYDTSKKSLK